MCRCGWAHDPEVPTSRLAWQTILYNSASAVSDANFIVFAKLPSTIRYLKLINDLSIKSGTTLGKRSGDLSG